MNVPGDPLTTGLPKTKLVIPQAVHGPTKQPRPQWPLVADPMAVTINQLQPGRIAYIRTRRGIRTYQIRTVHRSTERGKHRGRTYLVAMTRHGWCRSFWADRVVSTQSVQRALTTPHPRALPRANIDG